MDDKRTWMADLHLWASGWTMTVWHWYWKHYMRTVMNLLRWSMVKFAGDRCDTYDEGCPCCELWKTHDTLRKQTYVDDDTF